MKKVFLTLLITVFLVVAFGSQVNYANLPKITWEELKDVNFEVIYQDESADGTIVLADGTIFIVEKK